MNKHNAYLKEENLLTLFSLNNIIIPEIQREYVWGNNPDVLKKFLLEIKAQATPCESCHFVHTKECVNVGFLYSYKPSYTKYESKRILDEFLIDGQQRITTLFLLLLYRAVVEERMDDFIAIFRADENAFELGFNYKVRNLTQQFVVELIQHAKNNGNTALDFISDIEDSPYWFLDDYKKDPSVTSMILALQSIKEIFDNANNLYFDYLLTNIHFWHFKTEATSQGEELYITMNSRGEQLADNEMKKARTLPSDKLCNFGKEWELWQTFFWRKRKDGKANNPNADKGFNNYLACIENLENFNKNSYNEYRVDIETIKTYMDALVHICSSEFREKVIQSYNYCKWFDSFINLLWEEINTYDGRWDIIDPRQGNQELRHDYQNKSVARNKSMLFWSWMTYFKKCENNIEDALLIRILHFYYIRYNCYKRSSTSINAIIDCFIETQGKIYTQEISVNYDGEEDNVNSKIFSDEEILLSKLSYLDESKTNKIEAQIWETQDLPFFIDGKGVGGNTIYDFFKDDDIIKRDNVLDSIRIFKENISTLLSNDHLIDIKRVLLFYEYSGRAFWIQQSPFYYINYETSSWKRIVRTQHFIEFYKEYISSSMPFLNQFLEDKRASFFKKNKTINRKDNPWSHRELLILYDIVSTNGIWDEKHENIAFWKKEQQFTNTIFLIQDTIWKAKRYYDQNAELCLKEDWRECIKKYGVTIVE